MITNLVAHLTQFTAQQNHQHSFILYNFPKFSVLSIDRPTELGRVQQLRLWQDRQVNSTCRGREGEREEGTMMGRVGGVLAEVFVCLSLLHHNSNYTVAVAVAVLGRCLPADPVHITYMTASVSGQRKRLRPLQRSLNQLMRLWSFWLGISIYLSIYLPRPARPSLQIPLAHIKNHQFTQGTWVMLAVKWRYKVEPPKTNSDRKTNTMYHMHSLGASKCMHVVHSVGFVIAVGFSGFTLINP